MSFGCGDVPKMARGRFLVFWVIFRKVFRSWISVPMNNLSSIDQSCITRNDIQANAWNYWIQRLTCPRLSTEIGALKELSKLRSLYTRLVSRVIVIEHVFNLQTIHYNVFIPFCIHSAQWRGFGVDLHTDLHNSCRTAVFVQFSNFSLKCLSFST